MTRAASATATAVALVTLRPTVTFNHMDGSFAEASPRAIRRYNGVLCVERRKRLLPITVTGPKAAIVNLGAQPLAENYADAQSIAPVQTLEQLGVKRAPKEPGSKPARGSAKPDLKLTAEDAIKALGRSLKGADEAQVHAMFTSIIAEMTASDEAKPKASTRRGKAAPRKARR